MYIFIWQLYGHSNISIFTACKYLLCFISSSSHAVIVKIFNFLTLSRMSAVKQPSSKNNANADGI